MNLKIEYINIDKLKPYEKNAKIHTTEQIKQIEQSIKQFGMVDPLGLWSVDNVIMVGNGRYMACKNLGINEVPCIRLDHLTDEERRAYALAHNKLTLNTDFDFDLLQQELDELLDFDMSEFGFDEIEAEVLPTEQDDVVPEVPEEPKAKLGDIYQLGEHRLMCGDTTLIDSVQKLMGDDMAAMVFTDPPYNVNYGATMKDKLRGLDNRKIMNDNLGDNFGQFLTDSLSNLMLFNDGAAYVCMSSSELHTLYNSFIDAGGKWSTFIIWAKNTFTLGRADYQRQYEPILYGWGIGKKHYWCGDRNQSDVWEYNKPLKNDIHPTMKPVELVERAILNSSEKGDIVLDGFGGGGSTLIAAEKTGRKARLMELDPKYVDVIIQRWEDFTGKRAIKL